jgi:hypothetical protein
MNKFDSESYVHSVINPNGLIDAILDPSFTQKVPEYDQRIALVSADITMYLVNEVGVHKDVASIVSARAIYGMLAATAITLDQPELDAIIIEADKLSNL